MPDDFSQESSISYLDPKTGAFIPFESGDQTFFISKAKGESSNTEQANILDEDIGLTFVNLATDIRLDAESSVNEGGSITYTATLTSTSRSEVVVTLSSGETILISAGETTGSISINAPEDDAYIDAEPLNVFIDSIDGGNFSSVTNLNGTDNPVTTQITDTIDNTHLSLTSTSTSTSTVTEGDAVQPYINKRSAK